GFQRRSIGRKSMESYRRIIDYRREKDRTGTYSMGENSQPARPRLFQSPTARDGWRCSLSDLSRTHRRDGNGETVLDPGYGMVYQLSPGDCGQLQQRILRNIHSLS